MSRYKLTKRVIDTMVGRGYNLVCKICEISLKQGDIIESKPSKYPRWKCEKCGNITNERPTKRIMVRGNWFFVCRKYNGEKGRICGGIVFNYGRKFYHAECYDKSHL